MIRTSFILGILALFVCGFALMPTFGFDKPKDWPEPQYDFGKNPLSKATVNLGRALFYDPLLSRDSTVSCASCHSPYNAFAHTDHDLSHGINDRIGTRNAPPLFNLAWHPVFMWDGAINHLDMQALAPISHPKERDDNISNVCNKLKGVAAYQSMFQAAFGDAEVTGERVLKALSQFQLTLVSANSKYDSVKRQEAVFNDQEQHGYELFLQHCNSCHREPLFSNFEFADNGLPIDTTLNDWGRMHITLQSKDSLHFKIPSLRNLEYTYPYMHDGRFKTLSKVLQHYNKGIEQRLTLADALKKDMGLTSNDRVDLIAFLLTLNDRSFVFNPQFGFPKN